MPVTVIDCFLRLALGAGGGAIILAVSFRDSDSKA
jgi:hypothetical protein